MYGKFMLGGCFDSANFVVLVMVSGNPSGYERYLGPCCVRAF